MAAKRLRGRPPKKVLRSKQVAAKRLRGRPPKEVLRSKKVEQLGYALLCKVLASLTWVISSLRTERDVADVVIAPPHAVPPERLHEFKKYKGGLRGLKVELKVTSSTPPCFWGSDEKSDGTRKRQKLWENTHCDVFIFIHCSELFSSQSDWAMYVVPRIEKNAELLNCESIQTLQKFKTSGIPRITTAKELSEQLAAAYVLKNN